VPAPGPHSDVRSGGRQAIAVLARLPSFSTNLALPIIKMRTSSRVLRSRGSAHPSARRRPPPADPGAPPPRRRGRSGLPSSNRDHPQRVVRAVGRCGRALLAVETPGNGARWSGIGTETSSGPRTGRTVKASRQATRAVPAIGVEAPGRTRDVRLRVHPFSARTQWANCFRYLALVMITLTARPRVSSSSRLATDWPQDSQFRSGSS